MDPSILKTTSESEEDQTVDRKVSAPLDPWTLHITERRREDTRNSCFDLNMALFKLYKQRQTSRGTQRICSSLYLFPIGILLAGKILGVPLRWLGNFLLLEALAGNY